MPPLSRKRDHEQARATALEGLATLLATPKGEPLREPCTKLVEWVFDGGGPRPVTGEALTMVMRKAVRAAVNRALTMVYAGHRQDVDPGVAARLTSFDLA